MTTAATGGSAIAGLGAEQPTGTPGAGRGRSLATLALFVAFAVIHTWPLAVHPASLSRNDNHDTVLNEWILAWVAHQAPRDPLHLFDANIFYPEPNTLAFSEHLFVPAMMAAPVLWLGGSPVLAYNLVLIAGLALTGWAMSRAVERWTGDWVAGVVAGSLAAMSSHTLTRLPHVQAQHLEFLPLALVTLDRLLVTPRIRDGARLALWFTLQSLVSMYLFVFTALALVMAVVARPGEWLGRRLRAVVPPLAVAALLSAVALAPFLLPYRTAHERQGLTRNLAEIEALSATWRNYLAPVSTLHCALWGDLVGTADPALFPGVVALVLAGVAVARGRAFSDPRARMCVSFGVAGLVLSFGPAMPGYDLLFRWIVPLQGLRAAARFGHLALVAVALLAGFGMAELRARYATKPWITGLSLMLLGAVHVEALRAPLRYEPFQGIPAIYDRLAADERGVVLELPLVESLGIHYNALYMLNSTRHWKPLVNGYSGFTPPGYEARCAALSDFPDAPALAALRELGVTHVVIHVDAFVALHGANRWARVRKSTDLQRLAVQDGIWLLRVR